MKRTIVRLPRYAPPNNYVKLKVSREGEPIAELFLWLRRSSCYYRGVPDDRNVVRQQGGNTPSDRIATFVEWLDRMVVPHAWEFRYQRGNADGRFVNANDFEPDSEWWTYFRIEMFISLPENATAVLAKFHFPDLVESIDEEEDSRWPVWPDAYATSQ